MTKADGKAAENGIIIVITTKQCSARSAQRIASCLAVTVLWCCARFARRRFIQGGPVAQWSEPAAHNRLVGGSSPPGPTMHSRNSGLEIKELRIGRRAPNPSLESEFWRYSAFVSAAANLVSLRSEHLSRSAPGKQAMMHVLLPFAAPALGHDDLRNRFALRGCWGMEFRDRGREAATKSARPLCITVRCNQRSNQGVAILSESDRVPRARSPAALPQFTARHL
jgi:hypothetical protein